MRIILSFIFGIFVSACSSGPETSATSYNRAGRPSGPSRVMNSRPVDAKSLHNSCIKERSEQYCRNRLGR